MRGKRLIHENLNEGLESLIFGSFAGLSCLRRWRQGQLPEHPPCFSARTALCGPFEITHPAPTKNEDPCTETRVDMCCVNKILIQKMNSRPLAGSGNGTDVRKQHNRVKHVTSTNAMLS